MTEAKNNYFDVNPDAVADPYGSTIFTIEEMRWADSIRKGSVFTAVEFQNPDGWVIPMYRVSGKFDGTELVVDLGQGDFMRALRVFQINKTQIGRTMRALNAGSTVEIGLVRQQP